MHMSFRHAMLAGASFAFLAISGATLTSSSAQAGPLAVAPKQNVVPAALTENVQYRRRARATRVGVRRAGIRHRGVRRAGVRYVRGGYRYGHNAFLPAAALGLFAGILGAATYGATAPFCDPYYYTSNYCPPYGGGYYPAYYGGFGGGYYPAYYGGYYPGYWGGGYPVYRSRRVIYRHVRGPRRVYVHRHVRPRVVRYRAVAPRRHFVGSRTYVRSGYRTVRARSRR